MCWALVVRLKTVDSPEGGVKALRVLKQRSNVHTFIYPLPIRLFIHETLSACLLGDKEANRAEGLDQICIFVS